MSQKRFEARLFLFCVILCLLRGGYALLPVCADNNYGDNCSEVCNARCARDTCDDTTGMCTDGCDSGYTGDYCDQECDPFTYGHECLQFCSINCADEEKPCNITNGHCPAGCIAGYYTETCEQPCTPYYYGENCVELCSEHCGGEVQECNSTNGHCLEGCMAGYEGPKCDYSPLEAVVFILRYVAFGFVGLFGITVLWVAYIYLRQAPPHVLKMKMASAKGDEPAERKASRPRKNRKSKSRKSVRKSDGMNKSATNKTEVSETLSSTLFEDPKNVAPMMKSVVYSSSSEMLGSSRNSFVTGPK